MNVITMDNGQADVLTVLVLAISHATARMAIILAIPEVAVAAEGVEAAIVVTVGEVAVEVQAHSETDIMTATTPDTPTALSMIWKNPITR